ncbi:MAG: InlB B-repeat-containing protein [Oscillospiraceae bacterium]|nr:InlB B-repeat-containing protein [Oscillospiraceae bacterium]
MFALSHKDWSDLGSAYWSKYPAISNNHLWTRTAWDSTNVYVVNTNGSSISVFAYAGQPITHREVYGVWVRVSETHFQVTEKHVDMSGSTIPGRGDTNTQVQNGSPYSKTIPAIEGYTIKGYKLDSFSNSLVANGTASIPSVTGNRVVYFVYERVEGYETHTLTYKANNGKSEPDYIQSANGVGAVTFTAVTHTTAKFTATAVRPVFTGWNTKADGSGDVYAAGAPVTVSDNLILYAQWKPLRYIVTKDSDPGTILATYHELQNAVNYIRDNGVPNQPYTITATEHDLDVNMTDHTNAVRFWKNLKVTLTSDAGGPYTLTQTQDRRHFDIQGELTLTNIILDVKTVGGGIFVRNILNLKEGAVIQNCTGSQAIGAAVYLYRDTDYAPSAFLNMYDGEIRNNKSTGSGPLNGGGGVYVPAGTAFNMHGGTISGNYANTTGTGYGGGVYIAGGTFNLHDGTIGGNYASITGDGSGGGVYVAADSTFNMTGGLIDENEATDGGGIYAVGALTLKGGTIGHCIAASRGGGVYAGGALTIENGVVITGNHLEGTGTGTTDTDGRGNGAGVHARGVFTMNGGVISNNTVSQGVSLRGGGVYVYSTSTKAIINGGTISGNYAKYHGGGIFSYAPLTVTGTASITGNLALAGGGVYANSGTDTFTMSGGEITENFLAKSTYTAGGNGAGVFVNGSGTMTAGTIAGNKAVNAVANWGGGVYGSFTMSGGIVEENVAAVGGGIHGAKVVVSGNAVVRNNIATGAGADPQSATAAPFSPTGKAKGGGVYARDSLIVEDSAKVTGNRLESEAETSHYGSGVYAQTYFEMRGGVIDKNSSDCQGTTYGGGVFAGKDIKITGGTIGGQSANDRNDADYGGGLFANLGAEKHLDKAADSSKTANATMSAGAIQYNTAAHDGGGLYIAVTNNAGNRGTFTMTGGSVTGNKAVQGDGGGIFTEDHDYSDPASTAKYMNIGIANTTISGNTAAIKHNPPSNASAFAARPANKFNGSLLDNDNINYHNPTPATTSLTVSKTVTGDFADKTKEFSFTIYFEDASGNPLTGMFYALKTDPAAQPAIVILNLDSSGTAAFKLKNGQSIAIADVRMDYSVQIIEAPDSSYKTSFTDNGGADSDTDLDVKDTGLRTMTVYRVFKFTNERDVAPPTGIDLGDAGALLLLPVLAGTAVLIYLTVKAVRNRRRKAH